MASSSRKRLLAIAVVALLVVLVELWLTSTYTSTRPAALTRPRGERPDRRREAVAESSDAEDGEEGGVELSDSAALEEEEPPPRARLAGADVVVGNAPAPAAAEPSVAAAPKVCSAFNRVPCKRALRVLVLTDGRPGPDRRLEMIVRSMRRCTHNVTLLHPVPEGERDPFSDAQYDARMAAMLGASEVYRRDLEAYVGSPRRWNGLYRMRSAWKVAALCSAMQFDAVLAPVQLEYGSSALSTAELVVPRLLKSLNGSDIKPFVVLLSDRAHSHLEKSVAQLRESSETSLGLWERARTIRTEWSKEVGRRLQSLYRYADFVAHRTPSDAKAEKGLLPDAAWVDERKPNWHTHVLHLSPAEFGPSAPERAHIAAADTRQKPGARPPTDIALLCDWSAFGLAPLRLFLEDTWPAVRARLSHAGGAELAPTLHILTRAPASAEWEQAATPRAPSAAKGAGALAAGADSGVVRVVYRTRRQALDALVRSRIAVVLAPADTGAPAEEMLLPLSIGVPVVAPTSAALQLGEAVDGYDSISGVVYVADKSAKLASVILRLYGSSQRLRELSEGAQRLWARWLEHRAGERRAVSPDRDVQQLMGKLCALVDADSPPVYTLHKKVLDADAKVIVERAREHNGGGEAHVRTLHTWAARIAAGDHCFAVHFNGQHATCCTAKGSGGSDADRMVVTYGAIQGSNGISAEMSSPEAESRCAAHLQNKHTWLHRKMAAERGSVAARMRAERKPRDTPTWEEESDGRTIDGLGAPDLGEVEPDIDAASAPSG